MLLFCKKENVKNARIMVYNKVNYGEDAGKNGNENAYVTRDMWEWIYYKISIKNLDTQRHSLYRQPIVEKAGEGNVRFFVNSIIKYGFLTLFTRLFIQGNSPIHFL